MQLIGSRIEDEFRKELEASRQAIMSGDGDTRLCSALRSYGTDASRCMVLQWIPEQGEEIYEVLHDSEVLHLEIPRDSSEVFVRSEALTDYLRRRHGRPHRIKLAVALDILQKGPY
jgi:hypothetical protein